MLGDSLKYSHPNKQKAKTKQKEMFHERSISVEAMRVNSYLFFICFKVCVTHLFFSPDFRICSGFQ